ncbi:hypothetical protein [Streptomyces sp. NPDC048428]|uniref:hypothetical protein n=1 Tax=Streptomyces sp. NPDC048428 TaxID=3154503 RepID=UPI00343DE6E6
MTVHITDVGAAILVVACVVGYLVYKHSKTTPGSTSKGDLVGAITCGVAVLTALVILFGGGADAQPPATPGDAASAPPGT